MARTWFGFYSYKIVVKHWSTPFGLSFPFIRSTAHMPLKLNFHTRGFSISNSLLKLKDAMKSSDCGQFGFWELECLKAVSRRSRHWKGPYVLVLGLTLLYSLIVTINSNCQFQLDVGGAITASPHTFISFVKLECSRLYLAKGAIQIPISLLRPPQHINPEVPLNLRLENPFPRVLHLYDDRSRNTSYIYFIPGFLMVW